MLRALAAMAAIGCVLAGCSYDYRQRTNRVAYSHGDAVRANLERQTVNPSRAASFSTRGLGQNGIIDPEANQAVVTVN